MDQLGSKIILFELAFLDTFYLQEFILTLGSIRTAAAVSLRLRKWVVTFPLVSLVRCSLIVSIPDLCPFSYFDYVQRCSQ